MAKVRKLTPETKPAYKYNINLQLSQLPREININNVIDHLQAQGITRDEFYRDRKIQFGSKQSIPSDRLIIYAKVFDCSTEDLMNHEIKAKSIREVMKKAVKTTLKVIAFILLSHALCSCVSYKSCPAYSNHYKPC